MARIRPASAYLKPDAPIRQIARRGRLGLRRDLRAVLPHIKDIFDRERALYLYQHGRVREIKDVIDWKHYREVLKAVFDRWAKIYEAAALLGVRKLNGSHSRRGRRVRFGKVAQLFAKAIGDRFNFDRFDDGTQKALRQEQDRLIRGLEDQARDVIDVAVRDAQLTGKGAAVAVDDIWSVIGLTDNQAQAVLNYERMLRNLDAGALKRTLRDDSFDAAYERAMASGVSLDDDTISDMVDAYEDAMYDYRADTIARTESTRAANKGLHDAYAQAIDRGALPDEAVKRFWLLGDNPCPICEDISDSNTEGVGVDEDFESSDGGIDDPPVHVNCACSVEYVTDLTMLPDEEDEQEQADEE